MTHSTDTVTTALYRAAQKWPERLALCSQDREWTWQQLHDDVEELAGLWNAHGVRPGTTVACFTDKRPEVVLSFLACCRLGAIYCPVNFKLKAKHIRDQLETAQVTVIITQRGREDILAKAGVHPDTHLIFSIDADASGLPFISNEKFPPVEYQPQADDICYLNYTSGSTGRPKGAETSHRHILSNAQMTIDALDFQPEDVFLGMFSVFMHPHELFHRSLLVGGTFVIVDSLSPRVIAEQIERWKVTWMMAVPSFYEMIRRFKNSTDRCPDISSLRVLESGGAYVSAEVVKQMETIFGARFVPVWGCTEATGVVLANQHHRGSGATGTVINGYHAKIVDTSGNIVPRGEVGELWISGPAIVSSYVGQPVESAAVFYQGWYQTGDLMCEQAEGLYRFVSRRSEMMKVGGIRVFPLEIEQVILSHPAVSACVVVRAVEELRGEVPHAIIQIKDGETLSEATLIQHCRALLALYKVPRKVSFWESIPMLANGKVDKARLREQLG